MCAREILKIPGVGKGSPTDADWQKVGELCLGATKANVAEGEFAGVELTFMGLNNQNLHNFLFRGFLKPWEAYTGAKINWIDLAQADYNAAPAAVDRDRHGRFRHHRDGRAVRGRHRRQGPASTRCPTGSRRRSTWTTTSATCKAPVGTWDGKTYRIIDRRRLPHLHLPHRLFHRPGDHRRDGHDRGCRRPGSRSTSSARS